MTRLFKYVGPPEIREAVLNHPAGTPLAKPSDLETWLEAVHHPRPATPYVATYTIGIDRLFRVADRHSEHVACAGGGPVVGAGEVGFAFEAGCLIVSDISNQSTGFCPDLDSWDQVRQTLDDIPLPHPGGFTAAFVFRLCPKCGERNLVKEDWFYCALCDADLPGRWNFE